MDKNYYRNQVRLLLQCLPVLKDQSAFALKGGTAINFFIQDLPRLSVDIDLTYTRRGDRTQAINDIQLTLIKIGEEIQHKRQKCQVRYLETRQGLKHKIIVTEGSTKIKIEPNFILRGTLLPISYADMNRAVEDKFNQQIHAIPMVAVEELYAGKMCAALSRQHPRDLFDIKILLEGRGITDEIRQAFVVYLACSPRPMHELLLPNLIEITQVYNDEFSNMAKAPVSLESLLDARQMLIGTLQQSLTANERHFLVSIKKGEPDYSLLTFKDLDTFPALQWKIINIKKMDKVIHRLMLSKLKSALAL